MRTFRIILMRKEKMDFDIFLYTVNGHSIIFRSFCQVFSQKNKCKNRKK